MGVNANDRLLVKSLAQAVIKKLSDAVRLVTVGVSNRHIHLCREDMDALFGAGSELTFRNALIQPGQFAAEETLTIRGPKGELSKVRVLGPLRGATQVEVSVSDGYALGIKPPIRDSGNLESSAGITLVGPRGQVQKTQGAIAALRHVHLDPDSAALLGLEDKQLVALEFGGERSAVLRNVLVRVSTQFLPEVHLDLDEANALCVRSGDIVRLVLPGEL